MSGACISGLLNVGTNEVSGSIFPMPFGLSIVGIRFSAPTISVGSQPQVCALTISDAVWLRLIGDTGTPERLRMRLLVRLSAASLRASERSMFGMISSDKEGAEAPSPRELAGGDARHGTDTGRMIDAQRQLLQDDAPRVIAVLAHRLVLRRTEERERAHGAIHDVVASPRGRRRRGDRDEAVRDDGVQLPEGRLHHLDVRLEPIVRRGDVAGVDVGARTRHGGEELPLV